MGAGADDVINLLNIGLEDISAVDVAGSSTALRFTDGGRLDIDGASDVTYRLSDGNAYGVDRDGKKLTQR